MALIVLLQILLPSLVGATAQYTHCSFTQGGYGSRCPSNMAGGSCADLLAKWHTGSVQPGCLRDACFESPITLGNHSANGFTAHFTSANQVEVFLPAGGKAGCFENNHINPSSTSAGVFAGQLLTAMLTERFYGKNLSSLFYSPLCEGLCSKLVGKNIKEVIWIANQVIAAQPGFDRSTHSPESLSNALDLFNNAFESCENTNPRCFVTSLTKSPTRSPTSLPTALPTGSPTGSTSALPTASPSTIPIDLQTSSPTTTTTTIPPLNNPTERATGAPTREISLPSEAPSDTPAPTGILGCNNTCTSTQGKYGKACNHTNTSCVVLKSQWVSTHPACLRDACFVGPIFLGNASFGGFRARFDTSAAIRTFLPTNGNPDVFNNCYVNPSFPTSAGIFAGHLLAAMLNQRFSGVNLDSLFYASTCPNLAPHIVGMSVRSLIWQANQIIAAQPGFDWAPMCTAELSIALALFNNAFENCENNNTLCFTCHPGNMSTSAPTSSMTTTASPTDMETDSPTGSPTIPPTDSPTDEQTSMPTDNPTNIPTYAQTSAPTDMPSDSPTDGQTRSPTGKPSEMPTGSSTISVPVDLPTSAPSDNPTNMPTYAQTSVPTDLPSDIPTGSPTSMPVDLPTSTPTDLPSDSPTKSPTYILTSAPTDMPTDEHTSSSTYKPSEMPTDSPTISVPVDLPTSAPTDLPSDSPTKSPTYTQTSAPTNMPTGSPSDSPTDEHTSLPTDKPSEMQTSSPIRVPVNLPTNSPTGFPSDTPTDSSTGSPTNRPTNVETSSPTGAPTGSETGSPTDEQTSSPTVKPTGSPTSVISDPPTNAPSASPTVITTGRPTNSPTGQLSSAPTSHPTTIITGCDTCTFTQTQYGTRCNDILAPFSSCDDLKSQWPSTHPG